jgi:hypothetical protein
MNEWKLAVGFSWTVSLTQLLAFYNGVTS